MEHSHPTDEMTKEQLTAIEEKIAGITQRLVRHDDLIFSKLETLCLTVQQYSDGLASLQKSMSLQQTMMDDMLRLINKLDKASDHSFPPSLSSPSIRFPPSTHPPTSHLHVSFQPSSLPFFNPPIPLSTSPSSTAPPLMNHQSLLIPSYFLSPPFHLVP